MNRDTEQTITRREFLEETWPVWATLALQVGGGLAARAVMKILRSLPDDRSPNSQSQFPNDPQEILEKTIVNPETKPETGVALLEHFGLRNRIVYILYGRPSKYGEPAWGSLSETQTAEQSWALFGTRKNQVKTQLEKAGPPVPEFGLSVLNPVYLSRNGPLEDVYVQKSLELAPHHDGILALNFNSIEEATATITSFSQTVPPESLRYLSLSLDIEHMSNHTVDAPSINKFAGWFAALHAAWDPKQEIPGFVFLYTIHPQGKLGSITNLEVLQQYYLNEGVFVIPITDAFGSAAQKMPALVSLVENLEPNTPEFPALAGTMEFVNKWGHVYDTSEVHEIFANLKGAPVYFFASQ